MPHNFDFSNINEIKEIKVEPKGWINDLYVQYAIHEDPKYFSGVPCFFWRVKGTLHTFVIPAIRLDYLSSGNYKSHFENALENFREDYITWKEKGFETDWEKEYEQQYSRFIII